MLKGNLFQFKYDTKKSAPASWKQWMLWLPAFQKVSSVYVSPDLMYDLSDLPNLSGPIAPTLADKGLELLNEQEREVAGETAWMMIGLKLEEQQRSLVTLLYTKPNHSTMCCQRLEIIQFIGWEEPELPICNSFSPPHAIFLSCFTHPTHVNRTGAAEKTCQ